MTYQDGNFTSGLKTSAQQPNNGSTYDGKSPQSAQTHPSITNKSPADLILSIKRCHDAICQRRAAWHGVWITVISTMNSFSFPYYFLLCTLCVNLGHNIKLQVPVELMFVFCDCDLFINQSTQPMRVMFPNYLFLFTQLH